MASRASRVPHAWGSVYVSSPLTHHNTQVAPRFTAEDTEAQNCLQNAPPRKGTQLPSCGSASFSRIPDLWTALAAPRRAGHGGGPGVLGFDGDAAVALQPHSVTTPGPRGKHGDTGVGSVDISVRSTPPPSLQGLRRGCPEVRAFWKQSRPVRLHITVCVSPGAHRITPRHMCDAGEIESSQVSGFSNSQLVLWMAASLPSPPLPAANSLQFPEASFDPILPQTSGSKVVGGSQGDFRI